MTSKTYSYRMEIEMPDMYEETVILELIELLYNESKRLADPIYKSKANAIYIKWSGLSFLSAEIKALDQAYAGKAALEIIDKSLIISKIETFLTTARAILDILSYCLSKSLQIAGVDMSFNDLRKKQKELPQWLAPFIVKSMAYDKNISMSKNGWLLTLVSDESLHGKSLRDFVMHSGTINLASVEQFGGGYLFVLKPRETDSKFYHIEDMVNNVYHGINELFELIIDKLSVTQEYRFLAFKKQTLYPLI